MSRKLVTKDEYRKDFCPKCGAYSDVGYYCPKCGSKMGATRKDEYYVCSDCGGYLGRETFVSSFPDYCTHCGAKT